MCVVKSNFFAGFTLFIFLMTYNNVYAKNSYKVCVPEQHYDSCLDMTNIVTKSKTEFECVKARDRVECLSLILHRQADFVPVDPEDMYVASRLPNQDFVVFQEYRTADEPDAEFRYEAVMVVHKDLPVSSLQGLRGLRSCHTGVNRNVGYKIPLTMLMRAGVLPPMNDRTISPKENELRALSQMFTKSCIVGKWSPDPKTNSAWKSKYSQLCALCQHPSVCDYPDDFSGYEGALRCLAHNDGQIAFTKVIFVRKFFGLPVGTIPASPSSENPDDFVYLCADGSKVPVREKACSWAARPWQGLLAHQDVMASLSPLRMKVKQLADEGFKSNSSWFTNVLGLSAKIHVVADNLPIAPMDYLSKANYTAVIERGHGPPEPVVRLCVASAVALEKCHIMSSFAFSRDIRPRLDCVQESSDDDCLRIVRDNGADLTAVEGIKVVRASTEYNLHPVFNEVYGPEKKLAYAVAIVRKGGSYRNVEGLRGKRSCHSPFGTFAGQHAPIYTLLKKNAINRDDCPLLKYLSEFFSGGSCLPGASDVANNPAGQLPDTLIKQCVAKGDPNNAGNSVHSCMTDGRGDVGFLSSLELNQFDSSLYELLCLNEAEGGRSPLSEYKTCNVGLIPPRAWLSAKDFIDDVSIAHTPLSLDELLDDRKDLFNIYGPFLKNNNVIFNNAASGLATTEKADFETYKSVFAQINSCNA